MSYKYSILGIFVLLATSAAFSQKRNLEYSLQSSFVGSTGKSAAFWAVSNQFGTISVKPNSALLRGGLFMNFDTVRKNKLDYSYGLDVLDRVDGKNQATLQQYFIKLRYRFLTFQAGRIEEVFGDQDSTLSSGGLLWSGNAQPMPKVTIGILNYTPVPFTKGYLEIKGALSHGWFEKDAYVKHEWLHHKYIYLQAGGNLPVHVHFGFHHFAQWGGVSPDYGRLPSSLKDYFVIFRAHQVDGDSSFIHANPDTPIGEFTNRIGNHLGSRNLGFDITLKSVKISAYYQSIFEDNSGLRWHNLPDGLWGISLKFPESKWLSGFVYEYLSTEDQSMSWEQDKLAKEPDNYFNHSIYTNGWTYKNFTLGNPLITSPLLLNQHDYKLDLKYDYLRNNRLIAHHIGIKGELQEVCYRFILTYSRNYGTYHYTFPNMKESLSTFLEIRKSLKLLSGIDASIILANDFGKMYSNNASILFTIRKRGTFSL